MVDGTLGQRVKELRKRKALSQEDLAEQSGLSLRTIQRVENETTKPTGETLKRIATALDVIPNELVYNKDEETPQKTVKTKYEYLHIFDDKLVISKTPKIGDMHEDYEKSVNNMSKTLMVFFIGIPIFFILAVVFFNMGKTGLAIYGASAGFAFLVIAFYTLLFTSGSSLIKKENIVKILIQKKLFFNVITIIYKENNRYKERHITIEQNQITTIKDGLLNYTKNIELKDKKTFSNEIFILFVICFPLFSSPVNGMNQSMYHGIVIFSLGFILIIKMILKHRKLSNISD